MDDFSMEEFEAFEAYRDAQLDLEMEQVGNIRGLIMAEVERNERLETKLMMLFFAVLGFLAGSLTAVLLLHLQ